MKFSTATSVAVLVIGGGVSTLVSGQTSASPASSQAEFQAGDFRFFVAQRFWFASWDVPLFDANVVIPNPASPVPVIQTGFLSAVESLIMPITSIGVGFGNWSLGASLTPSTDVSIAQAASGEVSRSEYDINLGYAINESLSVALIYKAGKINNNITISASNLLGDSVGQDLSGVLIGISGRGKVAESFTMYGNAAFGPGRTTNKSTQFGNTKSDFIYSIGEVGVSYAFPSTSFGSWSIQAGYRIQSVLIKDVELFTIDPSSSVIISTATKNIQSTTQGIVLGLSVAF